MDSLIEYRESLSMAVAKQWSSLMYWTTLREEEMEMNIFSKWNISICRQLLKNMSIWSNNYGKFHV